MDVNKDEAERCIEYAERFILDGEKDKAEKFLRKAERLFPTQKAKGKSRLHFFILHVCSAYQNKDSKQFRKEALFVKSDTSTGEYIKQIL
jgi:hypothetical protein